MVDRLEELLALLEDEDDEDEREDAQLGKMVVEKLTVVAKSRMETAA